MPYAWPDVLKSKLASLFATDADRSAAAAALSGVLAGGEGARVAVACLKLAGSDLLELQECARMAMIDYRDILAWAEYPRQMRLGPGAPADDQSRARREDADEYARWVERT